MQGASAAVPEHQAGIRGDIDVRSLQSCASLGHDRGFRRPAAHRDRRARPAVRRHRPARNCARAWDLPVSADRPGPVLRHLCARPTPGSRSPSRRWRSSRTYGSAGFAVLERTTAALRDARVLVLADAKRGDIGSTMAAYAQAWVGDGLAGRRRRHRIALPRIPVRCSRFSTWPPPAGARVFVLAATSSPEGQCPAMRFSGARTVAQSVVDDAAAVNRAALPQPGSVGVVIGATLDQVPDVSDLGGPVLVPGVRRPGCDRPEALGGLERRRPGQLRFRQCPREVPRAGPDFAAVRRAGERVARRGCLPRLSWANEKN